jgi:hypothetical protein
METTLTPQNITVTIYPFTDEVTPVPPAMPSPGTPGTATPGAIKGSLDLKNAITIDLAPYYSDLCCFEVIAVQSADTRKQDGVFITTDKNGIIYQPDLKNNYWKTADDYDVIEYCIRDIGSGQTVVATLTLQVIERGLFDAVDICINVPFDYIIEGDEFSKYDLAELNKFEEVQVVQIGAYNTKLIKLITFDSEIQSKIIAYSNRQCNNWYIGKRTEVEYAISALVNGEYSTSKAKLIFTCIGNLFHAENIELEVSEPMPAFILINVKDYNPLYAEIAIDSVGATPTERGSISILAPYTVRYDFNLGSGFWDSADARDVFRYTLYNSTTGKKACTNIAISKIPDNPSGSGSGSGSGGGGNFETITGGGLTLTATATPVIFTAAGILMTPIHPGGIFNGTIEYKGFTAAGHRYDILSGTFAGFTVFSGKVYSAMPPASSITITGGEIYYQ